MKIKNIFVCVFFVVAMIFLSGCGEQQQIHQKLVIQGICVDIDEKGYTLTVQALDFQNPVSKDEPNVKVLEIKGVSLVEALENISKQTNLTPVYSQNLIIAIGESVAKEGVDGFMEFFVRHFEARPKVKVCVTKGKSSELFKLKLNGEPLKASNIHDLIPDELNSDVLHFVSNLKSKISDPCAAWLDVVSQVNGDNVCVKGVGIFSGDVLKEFLEGDEAFAFMLLKGVPHFGSYVIEVDGVGEVTCSADKISSKTSVEIKDCIPVFNIGLEVEVSSFSVNKKFNASVDESAKFLIRDKFSENTVVLCESVINRLVSSKSDVLNLGKILKNSHPQYFKNLEEEWSKHMKKCLYRISEKAKVKIIGREPL